MNRRDCSRNGSVPPPCNPKYYRRPEVEKALENWYAQRDSERLESLEEAVADPGYFSAEALVHICMWAWRRGKRKVLEMAFEAFTKKATPLVIHRFRGLGEDEREELTQDFLLSVFEDIRAGRVGFAEINFATFAHRRAITLYRRRMQGNRFENSNQREDPTEDSDLHDTLSDPRPIPEVLALLVNLLDRPGERDRQIVVQCHLLGMTQEEIAEHHGITARTVRNRLRAAERELRSLGGEGHDC